MDGWDGWFDEVDEVAQVSCNASDRWVRCLLFVHSNIVQVVEGDDVGRSLFLLDVSASLPLIWRG